MNLRNLLAGLLMMCAALTHADLTIVQDGQPQATIVLPAVTELNRYLEPSPEEVTAYLKERFPTADEEMLNELRAGLPKHRATEAKRVGDEEELAVSELVEFVGKISGAELPVVRLEAGAALPGGNLILLGAELARAEGFGTELDGLEPDGILLKVKGNHLVLSGRRARGTLYAAYEFLESLGCRWVMPTEFGEIYPSEKTLTTAVDKVENPSHRVRYWWCTYGQGKEYPQWTLRNKGNFVRALEDQAIQQGHALSQPLHWAPNQPQYSDVTHTETQQKLRWVKKEDGTRVREPYDAQVKVLNDDYYAYVNGKYRHSTPNMSNPKVWDLYADYYENYFKTKPYNDYVSISAEDGLVEDDRPESRELDSYEFDRFASSYSATDRLWFFHRRFIEKVLQKYPNRKFGVLVYSNNMAPPRVEHVHPAMALIFAPLGICPVHDVRDPKCKTNREYAKWLPAWMAQARAVGAETYYYDYDPLGFQWNNFMICPQWAIIGKNYRWFWQMGLTGHTTQGHDDWGSTCFTHWLMIRLYWNADQDYKAVLADYCNIRFGKAGPAVMDYLNILEERMAEVPDLCSNEIWGNHLVLTADVRAKCRAALEQAAKLADTDRDKAQLQTVIDLQTTTDAFCDGIELARETGDFAKAAAVIEPAFAIRDKLNAIYSHFIQPNRTSKETKTRYLPGGWYNKYLEWDAKIKGSGASVALPRTMKIALDTDNVSWTKGWQNPGADVSSLPDGDSTLIPDVTYQTQRDVAAFFYRTDVAVPASFAGHKKVELYFPSLIARAVQVWVNGVPVQFPHEQGYTDTTWRGPRTFWYNYNHQVSFDISGMIEPGKTNTIAFRVFKSFDHGGSYDRIFLLADPPVKE